MTQTDRRLTIIYVHGKPTPMEFETSNNAASAAQPLGSCSASQTFSIPEDALRAQLFVGALISKGALGCAVRAKNEQLACTDPICRSRSLECWV